MSEKIKRIVSVMLAVLMIVMSIDTTTLAAAVTEQSEKNIETEEQIENSPEAFNETQVKEESGPTISVNSLKLYYEILPNVEKSIKINKIENLHDLQDSNYLIIVLPEKVEIDNEKYVIQELKSECLKDYENLTAITIPESVETIPDELFKNYKDLIIYCNGASNGHQYAFRNKLQSNTESIKISFPEVRVGETKKVNVEAVPEFFTEDNKITWSIENEQIASIDKEGNVKALAIGETTIIANIEGIKAKCSVKVSAIEKKGRIQEEPKPITNSEPTQSQEGFVIENGTLIAFSGTQKEVVVPNGVQAIGSSAFLNNRTITKVTLPEGITSIGASAFKNCIALGQINLRDSITSIGELAFTGCDALKNTGVQEAAGDTFHLPSGLNSLGSSAFSSCSQLSGTLTLPQGVASIESSTFYGCNGLSGEVSIPNGVTSISHGAFAYCGNLTSVIIGSGVTFIDNYDHNYTGPFAGCLKVERMTFLGEKPPIIGNIYNFFSAMSGLKTVWVPKNCYAIYQNTYGQDLPVNTRLKETGGSDYLVDEGGILTAYMGEESELTVPEGVKAIGSSAFLNNRSVTKVTLPEGISIIGANAFKNCTALEQINLRDSITSIGEYAFDECQALKNTGVQEAGGGILGTNQVKGDMFHLPSGLNSLGYGTFFNCNGLTGNLVIPEGITVINGSTFRGCSGLNGALTLPSRLSNIGNNAFDGCSQLSGMLNLPQGVTSIGEHAFEDCNSISGTLNLPSGLTSLGGESFYNCMGLTGNLVIPEGIIEIKQGTFRYCRGLDGTLTLPSGLSSIGDSAFDGCNQLSGTLNLPQGVTSIGVGAFGGCSQLSGTLNLPSGLTSLGGGAFYNCMGLTGNLVIPEGITVIDVVTFNGCSGLGGTLTLPSGLSSIGNCAFSGCNQLSGTLTLPQGVTSIEHGAFMGCSQLSGTLTLPQGVTSIGSSAFSGCSQLSGEVIIPNSVTSIGQSAFEYCGNLTSFIIGSGVTSIDNYHNPFEGCSKVERMTFLGEKPPAISDVYGFFRGLSGLKTIYASEGSLNIYKETYGPYVNSSVTFSSDTLAIPIGNFNSGKVYSKTVELKWNAAINQRIVGYRIYRNRSETAFSQGHPSNEKIRIAETTELAYIDTVPETGVEYTYSICGYAENGDETSSAQLKVTPRSPAVNSVYTDNMFDKVGITNSKIYANVKNTRNLDALGDKLTVGKFFYTDHEGIRIQIGKDQIRYTHMADGTASYAVDWNIENIKPGIYDVEFELIDIDGITSKIAKKITVDDSRPDKISSVIAVGDTNKIALSWSISHELDTEIYRIYRRKESEDSFKVLKTIKGREIKSYTDTTATDDEKYYYYVVGVNDFGQEGLASRTASAKPQTDKEAPQVVQLTPVNNSIVGNSMNICAQAKDNIAVTRTVLFVSVDNGANWQEIASSNTDTCSANYDTSQWAEKILQVKALAYDAAGNESSALIFQYKADNHGPEKVTGLSYESTATTVTLRWNDVADKDFSFFRLEQQNPDGSFSTVKDIYETLGANLNRLSSNTTYIYRVVAYDQIGNRGIVSDIVQVLTKNDTVAPVISSIQPGPGYFKDFINVSIRAEDDSAVSKILIQTSLDTILWKDVIEIPCEGITSSVNVQHQFDLSSYAEGNLYVRAVATDLSGNRGDTSSKAPYVQYIVDRTAPDTPKDISVNAGDGAIELKWTMGTEKDLNDYRIYRSEDEVNYNLIQSGVHSVNYWDRSIEKGKTYWYKVAVADYADNLSAFSDSVSATLPEDSQPPQINSFSPAENTKIGPLTNNFSVMVSDNWKVASAEVVYTVNGSTQMNTLISEVAVNNYYKVLTASIPLEKLNNGDEIHLTIKVTDAQGLEASKKTTYIIDKVAPIVKMVKSTSDSQKITINWTGNKEADLSGYKVYRRMDDNEYKLIGQRAATSTNQYEYLDYNAEKNHTYTYKIEAMDLAGNTSSKESENIWLEVVPEVDAIFNCDIEQEIKVEYLYDATTSFADRGIKSYCFNFGDGKIVNGTDSKVKHKYSQSGTYTVELTVTDNDGKVDTMTRKITVSEPQLLGTVRVRAVDNNGNVISGMPIYFDFDNTSENVKYTDASGYATFVATAAQYSIGAYADGYLPIKKSVVIQADSEAEIELTMVKQPIVTGQFEVNRMTLDEIIATGIDISDPANQQVVKITIHLTYGLQPVDFTVYHNGSNTTVGGNVNSSTQIIDTNEGKREVTASVVDVGKGTGGTGGITNKNNYIIALVDIPVEASFLKEFFDVKLHIINNASQEFNLSNNRVELNIPEGMSLVKTDKTIESNSVSFPNLAGQEEKTLSWALRGDKEGEYNLSANYESVLDQFQIPVKATFKTESPIKVYGLSAIKLIAEINTSIANEALYFNLAMENVGGADVYMPSIDVMANTITAYQGFKKKDNQPTGKDSVVKQLNAMFQNSSGLKQAIGMDQRINALSPGEIYTKNYVAYSAITSADIAYLQEAIYEIAKSTGVQVEIRKKTFDLYSVESAQEKVNDIFSDQEKKHAFEDITNNTNYYYWLQAVENDDNWFKQFGEELYRSTYCVLNFKPEMFTHDKEREITRNIIYQMMQDETYASVCAEKIDDTYLKAASDVLSLFENELRSEGVEEAALNTFISGAKSGKNLNSLASAIKTGDQYNFINRLQSIGTSIGVGVAVKASIQALYKSDKTVEWICSSINKQCGNINNIVGGVQNVVNLWNHSIELSNQMLQISVNKEVALDLMETILSSEYIKETATYDEVLKMKKELTTGATKQEDYFVNELGKAVAGGAGQFAAEQTIKILDSVFESKGSKIMTLMSVAFSIVDYIGDLSGRVDAVQELRISSWLTLAVFEAMQTSRNTDPIRFLSCIKYMTKLRLIGEKTYVLTTKKYGKVDEILKAINEERKLKFTALDDYYTYVQNRLLSERDTIFSTYYTEVNIPDGPEVSISYEKEKTNESFNSFYEYSWDGVKWTSCTNDYISINPSIVNQYLWVRQKKSPTNKAGNVKKITVAPRERIIGDVSVKYKNGKYVITGLDEGSYQYALANTSTEDLNTISGQFEVNASREITISGNKSNYFLIRKNASPFSFRSQIKSIEVETSVQVNIKNNDNNGEVTGAGEYFKNERATVTATPKKGYNFVGWYIGKEKVSSAPTYQFTVKENVTLEACYDKIKNGVVVLRSDPENLGKLTGGGIHKLNTEITISAEKIPGYNFNGWYTKDGALISKERSYKFMLEVEAVEYVARYDNLGKAVVTVYSGSKDGFAVNDENYTSEYSEALPIGSEMVLKADNQNGNFSYWSNSMGCRVSLVPEYKFVVSQSETYSAVYNQSSQSEVLYLSDFGQVIKREAVKTGTLITAPIGPSKLGYSFERWSLTPEEVNEKVKANEKLIVVTPVYREKGKYYSLQVLNGSVNFIEGEKNGLGDYKNGTIVGIRPNSAPEGKKFACWKDKDGNVLSYREDYKFVVSKDTKVEATFVDIAAIVEQKPTIVITNVEGYLENGSSKILFTATRDIPDKYTVLSTGIIMTNDRTIANANDKFILGGNNVLKGTATSKLNRGAYSLAKRDVIDKENWYAKGYVIYADSEGNQYILYSALASGQYNSTTDLNKAYYSVRIENGDIISSTEKPNELGNYPSGAIITVKSKKAENGQFFSHWELVDTGGVAGYQETYKFIVTREIGYRAVFVKDPIEALPAIAITDKKSYIEDGSKKIAFTAIRNTPDKFSVISTGMILTCNATVGSDPNQFLIGGTDVLKGTATMKGNNGSYTLVKKNAEENVRWYARGFLIYQDNQGKQNTIYSLIENYAYVSN